MQMSKEETVVHFFGWNFGNIDEAWNEQHKVHQCTENVVLKCVYIFLCLGSKKCGGRRGPIEGEISFVKKGSTVTVLQIEWLMNEKRLWNNGGVALTGDARSTREGIWQLWKLTYLLTYLLTPWSRVLEQLTRFQSVKKFPAFYGTRRFITAFTSGRHLSLS